MPGHPQTLQRRHPGNMNAVKHGAYSSRALAPRAREIAAALMELPHAVPIDVVAAEEIGTLVARLEAIDRDLDERGHFGRGGARVLLDHKARLTRELRAWLKEFGGSPKARAEWARTLGAGTLADEIARRRHEVER